MRTQTRLRRGWRPQLDPRTVRRARILARLGEGSQGPLTTLIAGPGWGKSTAMAQFADELAVPVAWVQLRDSDGNVTALALRLADVLAEEFPGFGADFERLLASIPTPADNWLTIARMITAEAAETLAAPFVLVLDDYQRVAQDEACNRLLGALIESLPDHLHLIVASRRELPPSLVRVRANAGEFRLDEQDLRFNEAEGVAYLRTFIREDGRDVRLAAFVQELEGWPLGLALLAGHLRKNPEIERLPAPHSALFDYLSEEILHDEPPDRRELLLAAAVPERFGPELLRYLLDRDVAESIDELYRRHVFVIRLDETGEWYRFHHLFRAYLKWKLEREMPLEARRRLERSTAKAWHVLGEEREAVRHELAAGDDERAAQTLLRLAPAMIASGRALTLQDWLDQLPEVVAQSHPVLLVHRANCRFMNRRMEECRRDAGLALNSAERQRDGAAIASAIELIIRSHAGADTRSDHESAVDFFERYQGHFSHEYAPYAQAAAEAACALADLNRFDEAREVFRWAFEHPAGRMELHASVLIFSGFYYHLPLGHLDEAFAQMQAAYEMGREHDALNFLPFFSAYLAWGHFYAGHHADARRIASELLPLAEERGMETTFSGSMALILGLTALRNRDVNMARSWSVRFEEWRQGRHGLWGEFWGHVLQAGLAAAEGNTPGFVAGVERALTSVRAQGSAFRRAEVLTELAALVVRSFPLASLVELAADLLTQALAAAREIKASYSQARAHLLLASMRGGEHLGAALRLSVEHQHDELWLEHERHVAAELLSRIEAEELEPAYVVRLRRRLAPTVKGRRAGLRIVTLGRFALSIDGEEIADARWGRPKVKLLFKYLLSAPSHSAHREVLMDVLWPALSTDAAKGNLKNAVYRLRRALEPDLVPGRRSRFVLAEGATYRLTLEPEDRWDAADFLERAEIARGSGQDEDFARAAALYGGEYLPEDIYHDWAFGLRETLRAAYGRLLSGWGESLAEQGAIERAIGVTERLLSFDPMLEAGHRALMRYYLALGWRDHALRQYRRCETVLRRELGLSPDAETTRLYQTLLLSQG